MQDKEVDTNLMGEVDRRDSISQEISALSCSMEHGNNFSASCDGGMRKHF